MLHSEPLVFSESLLQITQNLPAYYFSGRDSSIDGDSSEDLEDEGSTDGEELDDLLRWPPEMCIAPEKPRRRRRRCKRDKGATSRAHEDNERREFGGLGGQRGDGLQRAGVGGAGRGIQCSVRPTG
jgi:hypothetical protein